MNAKQWTVILLGVCFLPVVIVIGALMALFGHDPFRELHRITREGEESEV